MCSSLVITGVPVARSLVFCVVFYIVICTFVIFRLVIVLSVLLRFTNFDYLPLISSSTSCIFLILNVKFSFFMQILSFIQDVDQFFLRMFFLLLTSRVALARITLTGRDTQSSIPYVTYKSVTILSE